MTVNNTIKVKVGIKEYEIPRIITCNRDGGIMGYSSKEKAYICINVEGCTNKITLKEFIKSNRKSKRESNREMEF
jgi:hypothetical protein